MSKRPVGHCAHCGRETIYAWVDTRCPDDNVIPVCVDCMNRAVVPFRTGDPAGKPDFERLLKPSDVAQVLGV